MVDMTKKPSPACRKQRKCSSVVMYLSTHILHNNCKLTFPLLFPSPHYLTKKGVCDGCHETITLDRDIRKGVHHCVSIANAVFKHCVAGTHQDDGIHSSGLCGFNLFDVVAEE